MINANYLSKVGMIYNFGEADTASPISCIFDRPIKKIRTINACSIYSDELVDEARTYSAGDVIYLPSIFGYPVELNISVAADNTDVIFEVIEYGDKPNFSYFNAVEPIAFDVNAETDTILGKLPSTFQSDVSINKASGSIEATLAYVEDWPQYSAVDNSGYFLAIAVSSSAADTTFTIYKSSNPSKAVELDEDMNAVVKITDLNDELVVVADDGTTKTTQKYSFDNIVLTPEV